MSDILDLQQQLAALLHPHTEGDTMRVDEVQGFMCAVLSGPDAVDIEEWLPEILGDEALFSDAEKAVALKLVTALAEAWQQQLQARELTLLLEDDEDGEPDYQTWANAYLFALDVVDTDWFEAAKLSPGKRKPKLNYFGIDASQPLSEWRRKGWLHQDDPRGWFQWYCRYYMGRRSPKEDERQIKRWIAIRRHIAQIKKYCRRGDVNCRRRQRQAVLHWAYDSRKM